MFEPVLNDPLVSAIQAIESGEHEDFWTFRSETKRRGAHALIHYPAMMVPTLQGKLLDAIKQANPKAKSVLDPFAGSGTMLVEAMSRGMDFSGIDINPLAVLTCSAKAGPYWVDSFKDKAKRLLSRVACDKGRAYYVCFPGQSKWFSNSASIALSRIARAIELEPEKWARRLFWVAFAKVVRSSCNSRMSTYKLHIKKDEDLAIKVAPVAIFERVLERFVFSFEEQERAWCESGVMVDGAYTGKVEVKLGDNRAELEESRYAGMFDVVMTSPPYGDNATTIPYGQYSYLALKWIPTEDICLDFNPRLLSNIYTVDSMSLGGSRRNASERGAALCDRYESVRTFASEIYQNTDAFKRFASFFADLDESVETVTRATKSSGYQSWTIGNRHLGGRRVPMEEILSEMLDSRGVKAIGQIRRKILAKKMAPRNSVSPTMSTETILLARKMKAEV